MLLDAPRLCAWSTNVNRGKHLGRVLYMRQALKLLHSLCKRLLPQIVNSTNLDKSEGTIELCLNIRLSLKLCLLEGVQIIASFELLNFPKSFGKFAHSLVHHGNPFCFFDVNFDNCHGCCCGGICDVACGIPIFCMSFGLLLALCPPRSSLGLFGFPFCLSGFLLDLSCFPRCISLRSLPPPFAFSLSIPEKIQDLTIF